MPDDCQLNGKLSIVETGITSLNIPVQYDIVQLILYNFIYCTLNKDKKVVQYMYTEHHVNQKVMGFKTITHLHKI